MPPLPFLSKTVGFLKCVHLSSVGLGLTDIPPEFGWDLVLFEPITEQSGVEAQTEIDGDMSVSVEGSEVLHKDSWAFELAKIGPASVPDPRKPQIEPKLVFEDRLDDFSEKVADIDLDEGPETPIEIVQTELVQIPQTSEGPGKKRIKVHAGRTDLPLVRQLIAMQAKEAKQAKASYSPSQPSSAKHKSTPKPSPKSYRLASQRTSRLFTPVGSSK